jgi:hypothetical protein
VGLKLHRTKDLGRVSEKRILPRKVLQNLVLTQSISLYYHNIREIEDLVRVSQLSRLLFRWEIMAGLKG